ncbi:phospholemman-like isoform X1 [Huso huso]|uniref:FXYD domain-containing ion transport regulator n=1 Tax=Huso huso TaxID=61971 RepID=A0ABR0YAX1_HUSHU
MSEVHANFPVRLFPLPAKNTSPASSPRVSSSGIGQVLLKMATVTALVFLTVLAAALVDATETAEKTDPFTYDYSQLRVGGLIMAAVLCLIGICILFSNHCRCKFKQDNRKRANGTATTTEHLLSSPARASEC